MNVIRGIRPIMKKEMKVAIPVFTGDFVRCFFICLLDI